MIENCAFDKESATKRKTAVRSDLWQRVINFRGEKKSEPDLLPLKMLSALRSSTWYIFIMAEGTRSFNFGNMQDHFVYFRTSCAARPKLKKTSTSSKGKSRTGEGSMPIHRDQTKRQHCHSL